MNRELSELESIIHYTFKQPKLLRQAMMHSSFINERHYQKDECNERLEFLGDAVLELVSSEFLFKADSKMPEGQLTRLRASIVCEPTLAFSAREMGLGDFLLLGKGEEVTGGRNRDSITSDALEALIGAIYLDGGFANAKEFILTFILNDLEHKKLFFDSKTILQELVQGEQSGELSYRLMKEEGPDHNKSFEVAAMIGEVPYGTGRGRTKKAAEQAAAVEAIMKIQKKRLK